jgi:uncharacterized protein (DUF983 family)
MPEEMDSRADWRLARPRQAARYIGRALTLHCPNCGGGPVLLGWFHLRVRCGNCGVRLERGEHDYFSGSILLSYSIGTLVFAIVLGIMIVASGPVVPWTAIEIVLVSMILLFPIVFFPFSKLLWLSADLIMRPVTAEELEWHRSAESQWSTERHAPTDSVKRRG